MLVVILPGMGLDCSPALTTRRQPANAAHSLGPRFKSRFYSMLIVILPGMGLEPTRQYY
ncbi:MAG: hypothetical protein K9L57_09665 [Spirochaetaceae bacterium]|nr:hypothetical protein [Spirochaetia bacterium]MCF7951888.1 hypothetical protein [Spirochaetaceae bacterium]